MTRENFEKKLMEKFPNEEYEIIYNGKNTYEDSILVCSKCNRRIVVNTGELFRKRRRHICSICCPEKRYDTKRNEEILLQRLKGKALDIAFFMEEGHHMIRFVCSKCGRTNIKRVSHFLKGKYDCGYCEGMKENKDHNCFQQELEEKYGKKFTLLSEYKNAKTSIKIKCNNCGFIREIKPPALLFSGYCPKCEKKNSLGEKQIIKFLEEKNIKYETQKYFSGWNIGIHYFDFYIPEYNLVLEYQGKQHYEFNSFFHKDEEDFAKRKKKDILKKDKAIFHNMNYVSIKYTLFNNINSILEYIFNSTTIPKGSSGKCLEIETIQDIG